MRTLIILSSMLFLLATGCTEPRNFDRRMHSTDPIFMSELPEKLSSAGIEFRVDPDGYIAYHGRDQERFALVEGRLKEELNTGVVMKFEGERKCHFVALLDSEKRKYRIEKRPDGEWLHWYPKDQKEAVDLPARALEQWIASNPTRAGDCGSSPPTTNDKPPSNLSLNKDAANRRLLA